MKKYDNWFIFYIVRPIQDIGELVGHAFGNLWNAIIGGWYCTYCCTYHSRRVISYRYRYTKDKKDIEVSIGIVGNTCCSKGIDAIRSKKWLPTHETLANFMEACNNLSGIIKSTEVINLEDMSNVQEEVHTSCDESIQN